MAVEPTGSPVWLRQNDHTKYGGNTEKKNYQSQDAINGKTDLSAQNLARIAADLAAVGRTAPTFVLTYTQDDTGAENPAIDSYLAMAGTPPAGVRNADGDVSWTWANSYTDDYSVSGAVHIVAATATIHGSSAGDPEVEILDVNTDDLNEVVRVRCTDEDGNAMQDVKVTLSVWTGPTT